MGRISKPGMVLGFGSMSLRVGFWDMVLRMAFWMAKGREILLHSWSMVSGERDSGISVGTWLALNLAHPASLVGEGESLPLGEW